MINIESEPDSICPISKITLSESPDNPVKNIGKILENFYAQNMPRIDLEKHNEINERFTTAITYF